MSLLSEQTLTARLKILGSDMLARNYPRRGNAGCVASVAPKKLARTLILILGILGLDFAGQGCDSQKSTDSPSLELTKIPPAAQGGRERIDTIAGRVRNARPRAADCYLCARWAMVGAALAALPRIVTEIDHVAPVHNRTYCHIVSVVGVPCADRMPLFIKKFSSDACFQQGPRRRAGESLQDRHIRT